MTKEVPVPDQAALGRHVPADFDALFRAEFGPLVSLARLVGSDDPTDTAQEAFVRLYLRWPTLRDPQAALAYARATVVNLVRNRRRHLAVAAKHANHASSDNASAEDQSLAHADSEILLEATRALSDDQRVAIVLRYWLDLPFAEIAHALDCRPATARSHVRRALKRLAPYLTSRGE